jgi:hypothetical protein
LILVVFGGFAFLFPLGLYCLLLAMLNRRWHPTLVSGPWDFAGVLFALSGFLLVGGPCLLTGLNKQWRNLWITGQLRDVTIRPADWWTFWVGLWVAYFVLVVGGAAYLLWRRRRITAIYNIDPQQLDEALSQVVARLGLLTTRIANRLFINGRSDGPLAPPSGDAVSDAGAYVPAEAIQGKLGTSVQTAPVPAGVSELVLDVDTTPTFRHATLTWSGRDPLLRRQVETALAKQLTETVSGENPVAGWLFTIAASVISIAFVCLILLVLYAYLALTK